MKRAWRRIACLSLMMLTAESGGASAANLDKPQCDALKAEQDQLVAAGVKSDMDKGPEWAKANLAPERLLQIKQLIEVGEQLVFRCGPLPAPVEAKLPGAPARKGKGRKANGEATAASDANADAEGANSSIVTSHLPPPDTGEAGPKKPKAAKRTAKRKTAGSAKGASAAKTE